MKFVIKTEGGSEMEIESGTEIVVSIDEKDYTISIQENGNIS